MGKAARTRRADYRKKQKRARKEQMNALYQSYKAAGSNKKKKANRNKNKSFKAAKHVVSNCGNPSCKKCGLISNQKTYERVKPYKTSKQKLSFTERKHAARRAAAKAVRQQRNKIQQVESAL